MAGMERGLSSPPQLLGLRGRGRGRDQGRKDGLVISSTESEGFPRFLTSVLRSLRRRRLVTREAGPSPRAAAAARTRARPSAAIRPWRRMAP